MKVGDRVKIRKGSHEFENRTGIICEVFVKEEDYEYDFHVKVSSNTTHLGLNIPFYSDELEVIS